MLHAPQRLKIGGNNASQSRTKLPQAISSLKRNTNKRTIWFLALRYGYVDSYIFNHAVFK
jgi:hypothetical protein